MNLGEFITMLKIQVPNIGQTGVTDPSLITLINKGANEANLLAKVYSGHTDFNIEADKKIYNLSDIVPNYLGSDKRGLFFLIDSEWKKIEPKTEAYISENFQNYLNAESVEQPNYFWLNADELGFYPAPNTSQASGGRLYHLKKAVPMTSNDHYPFSGSTTELTVLQAMDDAILDWCLWKLKPAYGAVTDVDLGYRRFLESCRRGASQIKRRRDLSNSNESGMRT